MDAQKGKLSQSANIPTRQSDDIVRADRSAVWATRLSVRNDFAGGF